jgi:predicted RNA-binding Zn-ribbon protein involved in translation (DUF1610 family)
VPIKMTCPSCAKTLSAPDTAAGKKAKCPACGTLMIVPDGVFDAEELNITSVEPPTPDYSPVDDLFGTGPSQSPVSALPGQEPMRRPCPMCGEQIVATAAKCRFCGSVFDARLRGTSAQGGKSFEGFAVTSMILGILSLFTACFGIVFGIVAIVFASIANNGMNKSHNHAGKGMATAGLITGLLGSIGWTLVYVVVFSFVRGPHRF